MARDYTAGSLVIHQPWSRATPASARVGAGYLIVENKGQAPDRLVGGSFSRADGFEIHEMAVKDGVMTMRPLTEGVEIAPGQSIALEPSGTHLMFPGLKQPLKRGESVGGTLVFEHAGTIQVEFQVEGLAAKSAGHDHGEGDDHAD
jgi:periplasmic copper chaperone A